MKIQTLQKNVGEVKLGLYEETKLNYPTPGKIWRSFQPALMIDSGP